VAVGDPVLVTLCFCVPICVCSQCLRRKSCCLPGSGHCLTVQPKQPGQQLARHLHVTVSQGFGGPRSSSSRIHTCTCITNHFFSLTDTISSASAILLQCIQPKRTLVHHKVQHLLHVAATQHDASTPTKTALTMTRKQVLLTALGLLPHHSAALHWRAPVCPSACCWRRHALRHYTTCTTLSSLHLTATPAAAVALSFPAICDCVKLGLDPTCVTAHMIAFNTQ
jgi:hypothetical protein